MLELKKRKGKIGAKCQVRVSYPVLCCREDIWDRAEMGHRCNHWVLYFASWVSQELFPWRDRRQSRLKSGEEWIGREQLWVLKIDISVKELCFAETSRVRKMFLQMERAGARRWAVVRSQWTTYTFLDSLSEIAFSTGHIFSNGKSSSFEGGFDFWKQPSQFRAKGGKSGEWSSWIICL